MNKLVSICIPAYKQTFFLKKCLDSVFSQTYTNYEVIVTDDTPGDTVKDFLKENYSEQKINYHKNEVSLGSPENWNQAIRFAKGEYIKMLHHDDFFVGKDSLQKFVSALESAPGISFVFSYSDIYFKSKDEHFLHKQTDTQLKRIKADPRFLFFRNCIGAPSAVLFKNDKSLSFNAEYKWLVDVEFYIRYLNKYKSFKCIKEDLVTIVDGSEEQVTKEVSVNKEVVIKENLNLFSAIYSRDLNNKKALLFFQELFLEFEIDSYKALDKSFTIPENIITFMEEVFVDLLKNKLIKKIKKRVLTSRYNKRFFKIERF